MQDDEIMSMSILDILELKCHLSIKKIPQVDIEKLSK